MKCLPTALLLSMMANLAFPDEPKPASETLSARVRILYLGAWGRVGAGERNKDFNHASQSVGLRENLEEDWGPFADIQARLTLAEGFRVGAFYQEGRIVGTATLDHHIDFDDGNYEAGERVEGEFHMRRLGIEADFRLADSAVVTLWGGFGIQYIRASQAVDFTRVLVPHLLTDDRENYKALPVFIRAEGILHLLPTLEASAEFRFSPFGIKFAAREYGAVEHFVVEAALRWRPVSWIEVSAGVDAQWIRLRYAGTEVDQDHGHNIVDVKLLGPFLALSVRF